MYQAGGDYVTADGAKVTVDTAAAQDWGQFIWDVFNKFKLADPKGLAGAFETGQQAMTEAGPGVGLAMQKNGGLENLGIASPIKRKSQQTAVFTNWLCVGAQTKVPDASWKFVEFYTRAANMQKFHELRGSPPPRKALQSQAYVKDNPVFRRFGEIAGQYGRAFTPSCAWTDFRQQLIDFNKELAEKQRTAKDVLPELGRDMAKALGDCSK
jgi:multiple sugar transport system substrate-binding protein